MNQRFNFYIFFLIILYFKLILSKSDDNFYQSFIKAYDLSGRYSHEYHPFILKKTRDSYLDLEKRIKQNNFSISGHLIILGYQEEAIPTYQTSWSRQTIKDEPIVKNHAGLCLPAKNIFGFMTGFILKDFEFLERTWNRSSNSHVEHIVANPIMLFDDNALIFQKHAFGKDFSYLLNIRDKIEYLLYQNDFKGILQELISFWSFFYKEASKSFSSEILCTQDILFSIDYARAIIKSLGEISKIFIGPDITYPIEVFACQNKEVTSHAQVFVEKFEKVLKPLEHKNTAYVFCSYVDGVGKSTLLNNIKNYKNFQNDINKYIRCDNSSSQDATIYKLKDKVYLIDLPAQMSHFVFKPDGYVFVDVQTVKRFDQYKIEHIKNYIFKNEQNLIASFGEILKEIEKNNMYLYESDDFLEQFAQVCFNMGLSEFNWIAFKYENEYFIFDKKNPKDIRILVPLNCAHSIGLKVVDPTHMLFSKGVSLPKKYDSFIDNLIDKLQKESIENVVFVDFLSMYPRSSRENIRINFILQYLKKIFGSKYSLEDSFYRHSTYKEQDICHLLLTKFEKVNRLMLYETVLRWSLFNMIQENSEKNELNVQGYALEKLIQFKIEKVIKDYSKDLKFEIMQRLNADKKSYYERFGLDKKYETLIRFSFNPLIKFSEVICLLFSEGIRDSYFNSLWSDLNSSKRKCLFNKEEISDLSKIFDLKYKIHYQSKDEEVLKDLFQLIRAQWYVLLSNLLNCFYDGSNLECLEIKQFVPPVFFIQYGNDINVLQKKLPIIEEGSINKNKLQSLIDYQILNYENKSRKWGNFYNKPHCLDWNNLGTYFGIYSFGYNPFKMPKNVVTSIFDEYKVECIKEGNSNFGLTTTELLKRICAKDLWPKIKREISDKNKKLVNIEPNDQRIHAIQLWARMIATLEMIIKDLRSVIFVRKKHKEDFISAIKLLENITLPYFYGLNFNKPLFDDYFSIEPVIPWDDLE